VRAAGTQPACQISMSYRLQLACGVVGS
jgi:hypothetical protein